MHVPHNTGWYDLVTLGFVVLSRSQVKACATVPIVANGDLFRPADLDHVVKLTNVDGTQIVSGVHVLHSIVSMFLRNCLSDDRPDLPDFF